MPSEAVVWMRRAPLPGFSMVMFTRTGNEGISPSKSRSEGEMLSSGRVEMGSPGWPWFTFS